MIFFSIVDALSVEAEDINMYKIANPESVTIDPSYSGPHLVFPLTHAQLQNLIQAFKSKQV